MAKIPFDKYYTSPIVARWCIEKTKEIIGEENITEWVEPSAGSGSFSHQLLGCKAYDLYPQHDYIEQADFGEVDLGGYKQGRCFIGNPPFGDSDGGLIKMFYNKSCDNGDYIAYIQPANFYYNYKEFKRFEIIYSCILETPYTNQKLKTSFTIYKRHPHINKFDNVDYSIPCVEYTHYRKSRKQKTEKLKPFDYSFTTWGDLLKEVKPYEKASVVGMRIDDDEFRSKIINFLKWLYFYNKDTSILQQLSISTPTLHTDVVNQFIRAAIPEINEKYPITNETTSIIL